MANKDLPFDDDVMTLIMGLGGPEEPGQHGRRSEPMPDKDTVELITNIRDMCDDFLKKLGKSPDEDKMEETKPSDNEEMETEEE